MQNDMDPADLPTVNVPPLLLGEVVHYVADNVDGEPVEYPAIVIEDDPPANPLRCIYRADLWVFARPEDGGIQFKADVERRALSTGLEDTWHTAGACGLPRRREIEAKLAEVEAQRETLHRQLGHSIGRF